MMVLLLVLFCMQSVPDEGVTFVVRSGCLIEKDQNGLKFLDSSSRTLLRGFPLEARCLHADVSLQTDNSGRIKKPAGFCLVMHRGSELYDPCFTWTHAPLVSPEKGGMRPFLAVFSALCALVLIAIPLRRFRRPRQGKAAVMPDEAAPEPAEVETSPQGQTFIPWRRPALQGRVLVWESARPLSGVKVLCVSHGKPAETASDENGDFSLPPDAVNIVLEKEGFHPVAVPRASGKLVVRMMSLPVRALWLLRQICRRHDPGRAARLSPRDAQKAGIPPPEVISRLEILAYGGVLPEPGELERLEKDLQLQN